MIPPVHPLGVQCSPEIDEAFEMFYGCKVKARYKRSKKYMHEMLLMRDAFITAWTMAKAEAFAEAQAKAKAEALAKFKAEILAEAKTTKEALPEVELPDWMR